MRNLLLLLLLLLRSVSMKEELRSPWIAWQWQQPQGVAPSRSLSHHHHRPYCPAARSLLPCQVCEREGLPPPHHHRSARGGAGVGV